MPMLSSATGGTPSRRAGLLIALTSALMFGAQAVAITGAANAGMGTGVLIFLRGLFVSACSLITCLVTGRSLRVPTGLL